MYLFLASLEDSGSDEDFMVEDDDDSDYGRSKKKKKMVKKSKPEKREKKVPKPRLKATGKCWRYITYCI